MNFNTAILTRRGGRQKNEDRADHTQTDSSALFVLADGMGGHPDGEIAAEIAVRTMIELFHKEARSGALQDPEDFLRKGLRTAHHRIIRYGTEQGLFDVPRTTAVVCLLQDSKIWWGNCGDSRLYLFRGRRIESCTVDHSVVQGVEDSWSNEADITKIEGISRSALYTCLGSMTLPQIDVTGSVRLEAGDRILLCSDGLWSAVPQEKIVAVLAENPNIKSAATNLVDSAVLAMGKQSDNVTVVAVEWMPTESSDIEENGGKKNINSIFSSSKGLESAINENIDQINKFLDRLENDKG